MKDRGTNGILRTFLVGEGLAPPENKGVYPISKSGKILHLQGFSLMISNRLSREEQAPPLPVRAGGNVGA